MIRCFDANWQGAVSQCDEEGRYTGRLRNDLRGTLGLDGMVPGTKEAPVQLVQRD